MLHILNLYNIICQLYLNKPEKKNYGKKIKRLKRVLSSANPCKPHGCFAFTKIEHQTDD